MEYTVYAIRLSYLEAFAQECFIAPHFFGIAIDRCAYGESLFGYDLNETNIIPEPPTLQSLLDYRMLHLCNEAENEVLVVFGRIADQHDVRTVAHVQTVQDLVRSRVNTIVVQTRLTLR